MENQEVEVRINKQPSFTETWYEGSVKFKDEDHKFWLIDPVGGDYEMEVRWFFKNVPREVRGLYNQIIESFKNFHEKNQANDQGGN